MSKHWIIQFGNGDRRVVHGDSEELARREARKEFPFLSSSAKIVDVFPM